MAKWDVTTAEGREAFERFVMARMGWQRTYMLSLPGWQHEKTGRVVADGWIYTGDGMVALKQWAAEEYGWEIESLVGNSFARAVVLHADPAYPRQIGKADDEPTAVALALARALEEMEAQGGGDES